MLYSPSVTLKMCIYLLMGCGIRKCEVWEESAYLNVHYHTRSWRKHMVASKKMDILHRDGLPYHMAQKLVIMEGNQRLSRSNLLLLGTPLYIGAIEELSNRQDLWNKQVCEIVVKGLLRKKIQLILLD